MEVACTDIIQKRILDEIKNRENVLRETYNNLKKTSVENKFFNSVLVDYERYYNYIITEKKQQLNALKNISEYLDKLIMNTTELNNKGKLLKNDQVKILKKLASVREELLELTQ